MKRVIHFEFQADDTERAKNFYKNVLGWKIEPMMTKEQGGMDYWGITTGDSSEAGINGGMYERPKDGEKNYFYECTVDVPDLDKALEAVKANGGTVVREKMEIPGVGFFALIKDTEGNRLVMMQPTQWQSK